MQEHLQELFNSKSAVKVSLIDNDPSGHTHGAVSVALTVVTLVPALGTRLTVAIQNLGANPIFIGGTGVTAANGFRIAAGATERGFTTRGAISAIATVGANDCRWFAENV